MTLEERILWYQYLRFRPVKFYRQRSIDRYVVDSYCAKAKPAIELDGSQHHMEEGQAYDLQRTAAPERYGITVLRFGNNDVKTNLEGV